MKLDFESVLTKLVLTRRDRSGRKRGVHMSPRGWASVVIELVMVFLCLLVEVIMMAKEFIGRMCSMIVLVPCMS